MKMKLTKIRIEKMANEIMNFLKDKELDDGVLIYFNGKRMRNDGVEDGEFDPHDYFEYAAYKHILSMSFEGDFYYVINYYDSRDYCDRIINKFNAILHKYGVYYEKGNSWNLTVFPEDDGMEVEYTYYSVDNQQKETIYIYRFDDMLIPSELRCIINMWRALQDKVGDVGSCVIGAGFEFDYKDNRYFMSPCSNYQGSISWEINKDDIEHLLELIGATNITYDWGRMD